jgi:hypothetical protein
MLHRMTRRAQFVLGFCTTGPILLAALIFTNWLEARASWLHAVPALLHKPSCLEVPKTQAFKAGQHAAVKVIGARPIDGLAVVSARPSVVAAAAAPAQLAAGQAVTGRIASIDDKGAILTLSPGVRSVL